MSRQQKQFLTNVAYRYFMLLASFGIGVLSVSVLPIAVSLSVFFHIGVWLLAVASLSIYVYRSVKKGASADIPDFKRTRGYAEFVVGFLIGAACSFEIILTGLLVPGALVTAGAGFLATMAGLVAYVALTIFTGNHQARERSRSYAAGITKSLFAIIVGALVVSLIGLITGTPVLMFGVELAMAVVFSVLLLGNMASIYDNQSVRIYSWGCGEYIEIKDNPAYCALLLFANTVDLAISCLRIVVALKSEDSKHMLRDALNTLIGAGFLYLGFRMVKALMDDTFKAGEFADTVGLPSYSDARFDDTSSSQQQPNYVASQNPANPVPAYGDVPPPPGYYESVLAGGVEVGA